MQAVILAAGEGRRLAPITRRIPKCLVEIAGVPILGRQIASLRKQGVRKIVVVAGSHCDKVESFLRGETVKLVRNPEYQTTNIIDSFWRAIRRRSFTIEDTLVMAGDVVFEDSVLERLCRKQAADLVLGISKKECGEEEVKVLLEGGKIFRLGKEVDSRSCYGEFLGIFKAGASVINRVKFVTGQMIAARKQRGYLFDMLNRLIEDKRWVIRGVRMDDLLWEEVDFCEDVERVSKRFSEARLNHAAS